MRVAVTNINLILHAAPQPFNSHAFITLKHTKSSTLTIKTMSSFMYNFIAYHKQISHSHHNVCSSTSGISFL